MTNVQSKYHNLFFSVCSKTQYTPLNLEIFYALYFQELTRPTLAAKVLTHIYLYETLSLRGGRAHLRCRHRGHP